MTLLRKKEINYLKTIPPHIYSADSVFKINWKQNGVFIPLFIAAIFVSGGSFLRTFVVVISTVCASEIFAGWCFKKKIDFKSGELIKTALIFSFVLPEALPWRIVICGSFFLVFISREMFGGKEAALFHDVLAARIFMCLCFPFEMRSETIFEGNGSFLILATIILMGGIVLWQKMVNKKEVLSYCFLCILGIVVIGTTETFLGNTAFILFAGFFLLNNPAIMSLDPKKASVFIIIVSVLSVLLSNYTNMINAVSVSILAMNLIMPWLDLKTKKLKRK